MTPTFEKYAAKFADPLLLIGRLLLSLIFLHESMTLIGGFTAASAYIAKAGVPRFMLLPTFALQFGAGIMLAFGFRARLGALCLGLFCLVTAFLFHTNFANKNELLHFEKDLAIAGGLFVLMVKGAGAWSVDGLLRGKALVSNS
jgi:putative oxidoreductase